MSEVFSGNFASGQTDDLLRTLNCCSKERALMTGGLDSQGSPYKTMKTPQCPPVLVKGGATSSGVLLQSQLKTLALADAANNLAVAKLRQIPGVPAPRFVQYQRLPYKELNPGPCFITTRNPAVPMAITERCINVVGIVQTWPPH